MRAALDHGVARLLAVFLGVVAVSALVSALVATFSRDDQPGAGAEPSGSVLSATADDDQDPGDPATIQPRQPASATFETAARKTPPDAPVALELLARDEVWVRVTVDGKTVLDTILEAGHSRVFGGQETIELRIGNAAGLTVIWNGTDLGSLGAKGQPRRLHFLPTRVGTGPPPATASN